MIQIHPERLRRSDKYCAPIEYFRKGFFYAIRHVAFGEFGILRLGGCYQARYRILYFAFVGFVAISGCVIATGLPFITCDCEESSGVKREIRR